MKYLPRKKTNNITPGFRLEVTGGYCSHLKLDITSDKYKLSDVIVDLYTKVYQAFIHLHFVFIRFYFFIL